MLSLRGSELSTRSHPAMGDFLVVCYNFFMIRKKKTDIKKLKEKLWELCKQIVRKRDGNVCIICGKQGLEGSGWHTGHFIASSTCGAFLRYNLRNLHSSCYYCNINLGGNGALFLIALEDIYGRQFVDNILRDRNISTKADILFYEEEIRKLEEIKDYSRSQLFDYTEKLGAR